MSSQVNYNGIFPFPLAQGLGFSISKWEQCFAWEDAYGQQGWTMRTWLAQDSVGATVVDGIIRLRIPFGWLTGLGKESDLDGEELWLGV